MPSAYWDAADLKALDAGGLINEDVMQKIWDISAIPLPFTDRIGSDTARNQYTEWTEDELSAADTDNAVVSGSDAAGNDAKGGARVGNHCQNSVKVVKVTERAQSVDVIGRADELAYQVMMRQRELRRDVEAIALSHQASVEDDNDTVEGRAGGFSAWLETNTNVGSGGANGGFDTATKLVDAPTVGDARALNFDRLKDVIENTFNSNGQPSVLMSVPGVIRRLNEFLVGSAGANYRAAPTANVQGSGGKVDQTAQGFINVLVTDFGFTLELVPNRLQATYDSADDPTPVAVADVLLIDPEYVALAYLKPYVTRPLGKVGLSERSQMSVDWTVKCYLEKAHAVLRDIDPTAAVVTD